MDHQQYQSQTIMYQQQQPNPTMYKHESDDSMLSQQKPSGPSAIYHEQTNDSMMAQRKVEIPTVSMQPEFAMLLPTDPLSPMSWPLWKKVFTSLASFMAVFTILYTTTTLSVAVPALPMALHTSTRLANLAFSIPFFGVTLAPIYTPHVSERFGRKPVYLVSFFLFSFVVLGGSFAKTIGQVLVIRFTAGLCAGPCAVLIEGTFADIWSANKTVSYYVFIALSQYWGAGLGQVIGAFVLNNKGNVSWLSYVALFFCAVTFPMLVYMPETYAREILRQKNKKCPGLPLAPALSGVTLGQMAMHTLVNPLKMFFFEPLVIMCTLYLGLNFALVFQWFISVPFVLSHVYNFSGTSVGLAFLSAIIGSIIAAVLSLVLDVVPKRDAHGMAKIETRIYPAMLGSALIVVALFWVGWSADPTTHSIVPITGTGVFVCGNMMILLSVISYIFDAYPAQGTLAALTTMACFRLICAGIVPIFILDMFGDLTGKWALGTFGFITIAMLPFPFILCFFGEKLRMGSRYSQTEDDNTWSCTYEMANRSHQMAA